MAWWRRDPSLFTRSPIHRYAQRVLNNHEAALRTRCLSRTSLKGAQHEDKSGGKRPPNTSDLEWMQLQHYYRWRKRLQDDPYKAIFGASDDMLNGKGLIDWEWINKSFPKWMLNDTDVSEQPQVKREPTSTVREPIFPQPSFRKTSLDRDGIQSPSDSRRPQEGSYIKVAGKASSKAQNDEPVVSRSILSNAPENTDQPLKSSPSDTVSSIGQPGSPEAFEKNETNYILNDEAKNLHELKRPGPAVQPSSPAPIRDPERNVLLRQLNKRELDFWDKVTGQDKSTLEDETFNQTTWRQTALQRRGLSASVQDPLPIDAGHSGHMSSAEPFSWKPQGNDEDLHKLPFGPSTLQGNRKSSDAPDEIASSSFVEPKTEKIASAPQSTLEKLKQLPEDDIDFLSAADISATMGSKRGWLPTTEQKEASRQDLERAFNGNEDIPSIHPMLEARTVNNQYVRRTERKMRDEQLAQESKTEIPEEAFVVEPTTDAPVESSIERMKKWLETTGASFAKTFWQDPTEEADVTKTKLFFDKVAHYVKKGQAANRQITEDLERDIPASKALLRRLKSDEERLGLAIHRLRQRTSSGHAQDLSPRKIRAMESLKTRFHQTNHELESAYDALQKLVGTESATTATGSFKRRLTAASKVLHKNSQLLRMLIWSLQTRLEDPKIDRNILPNYKVVADSLLSLRDTQMTLMRLVDRAMLVYGVVPAGPANNNAVKIELGDFENCEDPFVRARLAADMHLIDEIKAHESQPRELSNDSSSTAQNLNNNQVRDEPSPLMNSLFRPFGPAIEKLGNKELRESAAEKAFEKEKRQLSDLKLVDEIKAAYEDTYGPIYVDQTQGLKDDPASGVGPKESSADTATLSSPIESPSQVATESTTGLDYQVEALSKSATTTAEVAIAAAPPIDDKDATGSTITQSQSDMAESTAPATPGFSAQDEQRAEEQKETTPGPRIEHLPTHYTILVRDSETEAMSITTSTTGPPRDTSPAVPLHLALSNLDNPAKFIPYITEGLEVVSAKKDILVLRDAVDSPMSTRSFNTMPSSSTGGGSEATLNHGVVNPIDGTTRLSPTGYVGPEESAEQLEKEFQERRNAADMVNGTREISQEQARINAKHRNAKRKGGAGSVVKTAIWVAGMCYVAGVIGEISTGGV
ncbi:hypothetical protein DE146DRAFT_240015 [Phaeosphaeria sp. MPI-PUGE-AT-0046c]|nr:hypothetical protein DE146DRAFT_240015 [Phaeosphaeria sp. MPI-PUGE-AT-0046c]